MSEPSQAILSDRRAQPFSPAAAAPAAGRPAMCSAIEIAIYDEFAAVEEEWRRFEGSADCTVFQAFDWLSTWHRHIGRRQCVNPAIVLGRRADGEPLFLLPLAVTPGFARRLTWLGCDLCDYNAPLLGADFSAELTAEGFRGLWHEIRGLLQQRLVHRHDLVELTKMPETVGAQVNPFVHLDVGLNPSGAHLTQLQGTWPEFYQAKRSSATRRRDRTKRKRLGQWGEVRFVAPHQRDDIARTLETLFEQKAKAFARMGVPDIFARPGYRDFFLDLATNPRTCHLVHVSRLDVGSIWAAVNLGLMFHGNYYHVLASYDGGEVARFGPGAAHLRDLLCHAIESRFRRFDFTIGDERYKLEWSDTTLNLYDHVAPATVRGWPLAMLVLAGFRLKRAIKQNPLFWNLFSWLRMAFGSKSSSLARTASPQGRLDER